MEFCTLTLFDQGRPVQPNGDRASRSIELSVGADAYFS